MRWSFYMLRGLARKSKEGCQTKNQSPFVLAMLEDQSNDLGSKLYGNRVAEIYSVSADYGQRDLV